MRRGPKGPTNTSSSPMMEARMVSMRRSAEDCMATVLQCLTTVDLSPVRSVTGRVLGVGENHANSHDLACFSRAMEATMTGYGPRIHLRLHPERRRQHPTRAARAHRPRPALRAPRQVRVHEPGWLGQGPHRREDAAR